VWLSRRDNPVARHRYAIVVGLATVLALLFGGLSSHPHVIDTSPEPPSIDAWPHCPPLTHHQEHCRAEQPAPANPAPSPVDDRALSPLIPECSVVTLTDPGTRSTATAASDRLLYCVWRI